jgi:hypothetical protein
MHRIFVRHYLPKLLIALCIRCGIAAAAIPCSPALATESRTSSDVKGVLVTLAQDTFHLERQQTPSVYVVISVSRCDDCIKQLASFISSNEAWAGIPYSIVFITSPSSSDRRTCRRYALQNFPAAAEVYFATSELVVKDTIIKPDIFTPSPFVILNSSRDATVLPYAQIFDREGKVRKTLAKRLHTFYHLKEQPND